MTLFSNSVSNSEKNPNLYIDSRHLTPFTNASHLLYCPSDLYRAKTEVLPKTVCRLFYPVKKVMMSNRKICPRSPVTVNSTNYCCPSQRSVDLFQEAVAAMAPNPRPKPQIGECLQVGSTRCSATMRSGLHNFSEPKGPGHSHVIHVHHW